MVVTVPVFDFAGFRSFTVNIAPFPIMKLFTQSHSLKDTVLVCGTVKFCHLTTEVFFTDESLIVGQDWLEINNSAKN